MKTGNKSDVRGGGGGEGEGKVVCLYLHLKQLY